MRLFITIIAIVATVTCFAQKPLNEKAKEIYFYKKDGVTEVSTKDSAVFVEVVTEPDKGEKLYDVQRFYKEGPLYFVSKSSDIHPINLQGQYISYYPNGSKKQIANFTNNKPRGETYTYYANGKQNLVMEYVWTRQKDKKILDPFKRDTLIKFQYDSAGNALVDNGKGHLKLYSDDYNTVIEEGDVANYKPIGIWKGIDLGRKITFTETFENGKIIEGKSTDSAGNHYTYLQRVKPVDFEGGELAFYKSLAQTIRYPAYSRENNHQGKAIIRVYVDENGKPGGYQLLQSVDQFIDAEAMRVVQMAPAFKPAEYYGHKEKGYKDIPVSFTLQY